MEHQHEDALAVDAKARKKLCVVNTPPAILGFSMWACFGGQKSGTHPEDLRIVFSESSLVIYQLKLYRVELEAVRVGCVAQVTHLPN
jgi:hypothetical protein